MIVLRANSRSSRAPAPAAGSGDAAGVATIFTEPSFRAGVDTMILQENFDRYSSVTDMGSTAYGTLLRVAPVPSPVLTSSPVDTSANQLITGRGGTGNAIRSSYPNGIPGDGTYAVNWETYPQTSPLVSDGTTYVYTQLYKRFTVNGTWPQAATIALKLMEWWRVSGSGRLQTNTHDHLPYSGNPAGWNTFIENIEEADSTDNDNALQPIPPRINDICNQGWYRYTWVEKPNTSGTPHVLTSRDGCSMMWIAPENAAGSLPVIGCHADLVGFVPTGSLGLAYKPYITSLAALDVLGVNDGISKLRWESSWTGDVIPDLTIDSDDLRVWTGPRWY